MFKKFLFAILVFGPTLAAAGSLVTPDNYYYWYDSSAVGNSFYRFTVGCPAEYPRLVSGSCGHRDNNSAQTDIVVNGAGGTNGSETSSWRCLIENNSGSSRAIRIGIICRK